METQSRRLTLFFLIGSFTLCISLRHSRCFYWNIGSCESGIFFFLGAGIWLAGGPGWNGGGYVVGCRVDGEAEWGWGERGFRGRSALISGDTRRRRASQLVFIYIYIYTYLYHVCICFLYQAKENIIDFPLWKLFEIHVS